MGVHWHGGGGVARRAITGLNPCKPKFRPPAPPLSVTFYFERHGLCDASQAYLTMVDDVCISLLLVLHGGSRTWGMQVASGGGGGGKQHNHTLNMGRKSQRRLPPEGCERLGTSRWHGRCGTGWCQKNFACVSR